MCVRELLCYDVFVCAENTVFAKAGPCTVSEDTKCIRSPNFFEGQTYLGNQYCVFFALQAAVLDTPPNSFDVDDSDRLSVDGISFRGSSGPTGMNVAAGAPINWQSSTFNHAAGFEVCASGESCRRSLLT